MTCGQRAGHGPLTLLLADGSPRFLHLLLRFFEAQDRMTVEVVGMASSGAGALVAAAVRRPQLIMTELDMPDLPGRELLARLRRQLPEAGIIALTRLSLATYRAVALAAGADAVIGKVTLGRELLPAIQQVASRFASGQPR